MKAANMNELVVSRLVILSLFILVLPACERSHDTSELQNVDVSPQALRQVTDAGEFEAYIKNGLAVPSVGEVVNFSPEVAPVTKPTVTNDVAGAPVENSGGDFSTTNTQEQNVDESDVIKYDGNFLYIATTPDYYYAEASSVTSPAPAVVAPENSSFETGIRVMQRVVDPAGDSAMVEIAWPKLSDTVTVDSLYLYQGTLVSIGNGFGAYEAVPVMYDLWYWGEPQTVLTLFDVAAPENIQAAHDIRLDGYLETSRRIDNMLYLVTRYTPYLPQITSLQADGDTDAAKAAIEQAGIDDLLPTITINNESQPLVSATDCYLPGQDPSVAESTVYGYASMLVLTAIDLQQPEKFNSVCFNAMSQGIYTSENAMYISASSQLDEIVIHKFDLNKGAPKYSASGFIDGHMGWRNPAFRMSESGDYLRVVSTEQSAFSNFNHQLFILKDDQQGLMAHSAVLPNEHFPEAIGKPGENITAVRFFGSRAYVVTFEQTDPLYVINLDNPQQPFIEGSLEIPGFSSYLHPVNENLLLGIG